MPMSRPDHHDVTAQADAALLGREGRSDAGINRNGRHVGIHFRRTNRPRHIDAIAQHIILAAIV